MRLLWQQIPSTIISEIFSSVDNFDGVVIDTEHSPFNVETLFSCIQVVKLSGKKCFVRLSYLDKTLTKICLDAGCDGLIFSTVETASQAKDIISYCRYPGKNYFIEGGSCVSHSPPHGRRGQGLVRENGWGAQPLGEHRPILIGQIETELGVNKIEEIAQTNVFDMFLIGPYDLSASLGCVGDFEDYRYKEAIDKIKESVSESSLGIHIPRNVESSIGNYSNFGFVALGMDTTFLLERIEEIGNG
jgi:2-keto-3-deoxy-L-rhamnonate aldolase RhmA